MSSQVCRRMKKENLDKKRLKGFDEPECSNGICEACKTITEYKCAFKRGMTEPCKTKGCARGRKCVKEEEEVCVVRPGTDISSFIHVLISVLALQMLQLILMARPLMIPKKSARSSVVSLLLFSLLFVSSFHVQRCHCLTIACLI